MRRLTLYGRVDCHLCDEMSGALEALSGPLGFAVDKRDVDADPALEARYGDRVPVLVDAAGREICHGRIDAAALRSRLELE